MASPSSPCPCRTASAIPAKSRTSFWQAGPVCHRQKGFGGTRHLRARPYPCEYLPGVGTRRLQGHKMLRGSPGLPSGGAISLYGSIVPGSPGYGVRLVCRQGKPSFISLCVHTYLYWVFVTGALTVRLSRSIPTTRYGRFPRVCSP